MARGYLYGAMDFFTCSCSSTTIAPERWKPGYAKGAPVAEALQAHVKQAIAPYKYPRAIEFVDALPRTETGKLQRFRLRTP